MKNLQLNTFCCSVEQHFLFSTLLNFDDIFRSFALTLRKEKEEEKEKKIKPSSLIVMTHPPHL